MTDRSPNLFLVGWPKTGSTSLFDYLGQHPQICVASRKDTYYFSDDLRVSSRQLHGSDRYNFVADLARYEQLFDHRDGEPVLCESSVFYALSETAASNIARQCPDAKIVALLREPVSLMRSWYNYQRLHSRETADTFEQALALEAARRSDPSAIPDSTYMPLHVFYRDLVQFDVGLRKLYEHFGPEQVLVLLSDDLRELPTQTAQRVYDFVGVRHDYVPEIKTRNVTVQPRFAAVKKVLDTTFLPAKSMLRRALPSGAHMQARRLYQLALTRSKPADDNVEPEVLDALRAELLPMIERTEKLVGIDLRSRWVGY